MIRFQDNFFFKSDSAVLGYTCKQQGIVLTIAPYRVIAVKFSKPVYDYVGEQSADFFLLFCQNKSIGKLQSIS